MIKKFNEFVNEELEAMGGKPESWHTFAELRDELKAKGIAEVKMPGLEGSGLFFLGRGDDDNGIHISCKPTTGEWTWQVFVNGATKVNGKYTVNLSNPAAIGQEGAKVKARILKEIGPYL